MILAFLKPLTLVGGFFYTKKQVKGGDYYAKGNTLRRQ